MTALGFEEEGQSKTPQKGQVKVSPRWFWVSWSLKIPEGRVNPLSHHWALEEDHQPRSFLACSVILQSYQYLLDTAGKGGLRNLLQALVGISY